MSLLVYFWKYKIQCKTMSIKTSFRRNVYCICYLIHGTRTRNRSHIGNHNGQTGHLCAFRLDYITIIVPRPKLFSEQLILLHIPCQQNIWNKVGTISSEVSILLPKQKSWIMRAHIFSQSRIYTCFHADKNYRNHVCINIHLFS